MKDFHTSQPANRKSSLTVELTESFESRHIIGLLQNHLKVTGTHRCQILIQHVKACSDIKCSIFRHMNFFNSEFLENLYML